MRNPFSICLHKRDSCYELTLYLHSSHRKFVNDIFMGGTELFKLIMDNGKFRLCAEIVAVYHMFNLLIIAVKWTNLSVKMWLRCYTVWYSFQIQGPNHNNGDWNRLFGKKLDTLETKYVFIVYYPYKDFWVKDYALVENLEKWLHLENLEICNF